MFSGFFLFSVYPHLPISTAPRPQGDTLSHRFCLADVPALFHQDLGNKKSPAYSRACAIATSGRRSGRGFDTEAGESRRTRGRSRNLRDALEAPAASVYQDARRPPCFPYARQPKESSTSVGSLEPKTSSDSVKLSRVVNLRAKARSPP